MEFLSKSPDLPAPWRGVVVDSGVEVSSLAAPWTKVEVDSGVEILSMSPDMAAP